MLVRNDIVSLGRSVSLATENEVQIGTRGVAINEILLVERRDWKDLHGSNSRCEDFDRIRWHSK